MLAVSTVPVYLAVDGYLSMNSWESFFWMGCLFLLIRMQQGGFSLRIGWLAFGICAGLGLLNKPSMAFFLAAVAVALLLTPQRRLLFNRHAVLGITVMLVVVAPNLVWQMQHSWPTLEFLQNGRDAHKTVNLPPLAFLGQQCMTLGPWTLLLWLPGLVHLLRRADRRWIGFIFVLFMAAMVAMAAKDYYATPVYPVLFAAGGLAWDLHFFRSRAVADGRLFAFPLLESLLVACGLLFLPTSNPVLRPLALVAYRQALHIANGNSERQQSGSLPQFYADRFGWQEEVDEVERILSTLSPQDRSRVGIFCSNYGEAGALEFLGHNLPPVISEHNTYWLWGTRGLDAEVMILISHDTPAEIGRYYREVQVVGHLNHPYSHAL